MSTLAQVTEEEKNTPGTIPDGFLYASFENIGSSVANVNGTRLQPGKAKDFPFVGKGYEAATYDPQSSTLNVMFVV